MKILKFGGTSVGSADNIKRIGEIVLSQQEKIIVVVSALGGVTDMLVALAQNAANGIDSTDELKALWKRHEEVIDGLYSKDLTNKATQELRPLFEQLEAVITEVAGNKELSHKNSDQILGFGERLSSLLISRYLGVPLLDSSLFIKTDLNYGRANVDFDLTYKLISKECSSIKQFTVAPGFISSGSDGSQTTLGRGGSDYTAALFAAGVHATQLEIWTDVDGFMTADPRVISKAYTIPMLTYSEAMELSHFGAKVIYPPTILPVYQKNIPIHIKNTLNPTGNGTLISQSELQGKDHPIKGISSITGISLFTIQGLGMVGVTGISMRLFGALAHKEINVILISQASSENSISFAIDSKYESIANQAISSEFEHEIASGMISKLACENELSILAIVGENMKHSAGIAGKLFHTLGKNGINVVAIAQGASELNISWVVKNTDLKKTLNVVHEAFFLSPFVELNIFLVGIGTVGRDLLEQIGRQQKKLLKDHRLKLKLSGVANSRRMIFDREGIDVKELKNSMGQSEIKSDLNEFTKTMVEMNLFNSVFVDCTADDKVANYYLYALENYISVVAANKVAASSEYSRYRELKEMAAKHGVKFLFETNVGAGLPLISTINDLMRSGDRIVRIEAVLSGTLNYIFNTLSKDITFSKAIKMAMEMGYAEPDPRIDLSGIDVIRKLVILARESGYVLEQGDVKNNAFIPEKYFSSSMDEFWNTIGEMDDVFEKQRVVLEQKKQKWRFVGVMNEGKASVTLVVVDPGHPFYDLEGSNNILLLTSERYNEYPMLIKGYGAGAAVTAAGVFADLIKVSNI
jgi:aspartokinase/homoserine dehydrogenase 1